jgi:hypothetical protein
VAVFAAGTAWAIRAATRAIAQGLDTAKGELVPLLQQARGIADDVKAMTTSAREEVERVRALVEETTGKMEAGLEVAEARLRRLDALAGMVQDEAEEAVISVAAAARGTQASMRAVKRDFLGGGWLGSLLKRGTGADDGDHGDDDDGEDGDGHELPDEPPPERPRVRHRHHSDRHA